MAFSVDMPGTLLSLVCRWIAIAAYTRAARGWVLQMLLGVVSTCEGCNHARIIRVNRQVVALRIGSLDVVWDMAIALALAKLARPPLAK